MFLAEGVEEEALKRILFVELIELINRRFSITYLVVVVVVVTVIIKLATVVEKRRKLKSDRLSEIGRERKRG